MFAKRCFFLRSQSPSLLMLPFQRGLCRGRMLVAVFCLEQRAKISATMYQAHHLYPSWHLTIQDQIPLHGKVAESCCDVRPRLAELGVFCEQGKILVETPYELCGTRRTLLGNIAPNTEQVFFRLARQAITGY
jgi:hypothetical protein